MNTVKKIFGGDIRQFGMVLALAIITAFFAWMTNGVAVSPQNIINIIQGNAYILVLAIGMVFVIIAGHIDLSVGSVAAVVGIVVAKSMSDWGMPWYVAILLGLLLGVLIGAWQGWWVAYVGVPGFIVTLAGYMIFRGANQMIGKSLTVATPKEFNFIGDGYLPEVGPNTGFNNLTVLLGIIVCAVIVSGVLRTRSAQRKIGADMESVAIVAVRTVLICVAIMAVMLLMASGRRGTSLPISGIILGLLILLYSFVANKTVIGRHVYAVGGNRNAAELSGVKSKRVYFLVMMNMSVLAALAGMMFVARSNASGPADGVGWELDAIAAVFIGGAAVSGGVGTVVGSMIGGLVMAMLNNGLQLMGVGADATYIIKGLVLLVAVAVDVLNKQQGRPSILGYLMAKRAATQAASAPVAAAKVPQDTV
ncbi:Xylose transport system permease protein XylH [Austwickia sp. TVS 96-490-7B]|uniref:multiple monosaccharide ABC transporter permease n=1 Tax=Austwickia sp. TVS 96-490-7B TaxID=2830843 RepID=UPI001C592D0B|nr:multiple monosaccharide ABC transporter permease [Austwickia sp. TVS 96-490-7B]MBW3085811.1 Xylose transport system permease protein XylH [Austwickia sp. TVS 96-490-7B]